MSQTDAILGYLKRRRTITPLEALDQLGCYRLAARVNELRAMGHGIETHMVEKNGKRFAQYRYHSKF